MIELTNEQRLELTKEIQVDDPLFYRKFLDLYIIKMAEVNNISGGEVLAWLATSQPPVDGWDDVARNKAPSGFIAVNGITATEFREALDKREAKPRDVVWLSDDPDNPFVRGNATEIGLRLRAARVKRELTLTETIHLLAAKGHMTTSISDLEAIEFGTRRITKSLLVILCTEIYDIEIRLIGGWTLASFGSDQEVFEAYHNEDDAAGIGLADVAEWFGVSRQDAAKILADGHRDWISRYTLARVAYNAKQRIAKPDERAAIVPYELLTDAEVKELEEMAGAIISYFVNTNRFVGAIKGKPDATPTPTDPRPDSIDHGISGEVSSEHRSDVPVE